VLPEGQVHGVVVGHGTFLVPARGVCASAGCWDGGCQQVSRHNYNVYAYVYTSVYSSLSSFFPPYSQGSSYHIAASNSKDKNGKIGNTRGVAGTRWQCCEGDLKCLL
jgi:hypothetical protein